MQQWVIRNKFMKNSQLQCVAQKSLTIAKRTGKSAKIVWYL